MQDAYTFEERCGDDDVLIEDADSFSVLLKCIRKIGGSVCFSNRGVPRTCTS